MGVVVLVGIVGLFAGCDGERTDRTTVSRETFVDVMVALRSEAFVSGEGVDEAARDSILDRYGVTEDALLEYARVHGARPEEMTEVWGEVERRLDSLRADPEDRAAPDGDPRASGGAGS